MDPAIVVFGFGIGLLVGMTGMGGASLMTPLLILIFGIQPVTAIGTDIFYGAVTKTVGGWQHLKHGTVHKGLAFWLAVGSVPSAIAGVWRDRAPAEHSTARTARPARPRDARRGAARGRRRDPAPAALPPRRDPGALRAAPLPPPHHRRGRSPAPTTGFVIGLTSAGSGTLIAIVLIAVFRLTPQRVVGTDVFHAAILLWAAGIAHWVGGNVDFGLAANILVGSIPGVLIGGQPRGQDPDRTSCATPLGRGADRLGDRADRQGEGSDRRADPVAQRRRAGRRRRSSPSRSACTVSACGSDEAKALAAAAQSGRLTPAPRGGPDRYAAPCGLRPEPARRGAARPRPGVHGRARLPGRGRGAAGARRRGRGPGIALPGDPRRDPRQGPRGRGALEPLHARRALRRRAHQLGVRDALRGDGPQPGDRADGVQLLGARHRQHGDPRRARHRRAEATHGSSRCSTARSAPASR